MRAIQALPSDVKLRVLDVSVWATIASALIASLFTLWGRASSGRTLVVVLLIASLLLLRRLASRRLAAASVLFCALLFSVITTVIVFYGGIRTPWTAGYIVVVLLAALLLGTRALAVFTAVSVLAGGVVTALGIYDLLPAPPIPVTQLSAWATLTAALIWAAVVLRFYGECIRRSESELSESEGLLRSVMTSSPDHIMRLDRDGRIVFINRTVSDLTVEEVLGRPVYEFVEDKYHGEMKACFERVFESGRQGSYYVDYEAADGNTLSFESRVSPITLDGETVALTVTSSNVTERIRASAEIGRLAALVENSRDFIALAELDGTIIYVNGAGLSIVGVSSSDSVRGRKITEYLVEEDRHRLETEVLPALRELGVWRGELRVRHRETGRSIPVELNSFVVEDTATGEIISVATVARDVSERKEAEAALALSEKQLLQAQKMEAVGMLAGGIAHDFNNILTVITGYSDLVLHADELTDSARKRLEGIAKAAERASSLTRQLLAFSRRQVLNPRVLDLVELLGDTEKMLSRMIGEDVKLVTSFPDRLGNIKADPGQIEQVLMNLAVNARHAMTSGGTLTLELEDIDVDDEAPLSSSPPNGSYVLLKVSDTGAGMEPEVLEKVFEPFFTTKELGRGTGLGLSTVYGIVKQSGGFIYAESEPGRGSSFSIYLPRVDESAARLEETTARDATGSESVLVVEDDPAVRDLACDVLRARGYDVAAAETGDEAIALVRDGRRIELLITDVVMPRMNGRELAERLSELQPSLRVLYMSGYSAKFMSDRGFLEGEAQLVQKPFTPQGLADKVREVLDGARQLTRAGRDASAPRRS